MAITGAWEAALKGEFRKPYYAKLYHTVVEEYRDRVIYPPSTDIFNAFAFTPLPEVKVVILGQDPYHEPGQAMGLSFSVHKGIRIPPSLVNIYAELQDDLGCYVPDNGDLTKWARQGVLLLNTVLTVRAHQANSHRGIGWEEFTGPADGLYPLGDACEKEEGASSQSEAPDPGVAPSVAAVGVRRLFREQALLEDECVSRTMRPFSDRLAD